MRPVPLGFVRRRSKAGPTHETASTSATDAAAPSWIQRSKQRAKPAPSVQPAPRMSLGDHRKGNAYLCSSDPRKAP